MSTQDLITYDELREALELNTTEDNYAIAGDFLLDALTDWPTFNLTEPADLLATLKDEVKAPLTFDNLEAYRDSLDMENENGWKKESLTALLELFDFTRRSHYDKAIELDTILSQLTEHFREEE